MKVVKHTIVVILLLVIIKSSCYAQIYYNESQQKKIDSINNVINNIENHDTTIAWAYICLSEILYLSNIDTMIPLCSKAKSIAERHLKKELSKHEKKSFLYIKAAAINNIGYTYKIRGNLNKALIYYKISLKIREELGVVKDLPISLNNIGLVYKTQGDLNKALEYYNRSVNISEEHGNNKALASAINNIGVIYYNQGDIPKALEYYHKGLKIREKEGDVKGVANSLNNIGAIYYTQGEYARSRDYFDECLKIAETLGFKKIIASSLNSIGHVYKKEGDLDITLKYYNKGLDIRYEIGDKKGVANSLNSIGSIYKMKGNYEKALEVFHESLRLRREIGDKEGIATNLHNIGLIYSKLSNIAKSVSFAQESFLVAQEIGYPENISNTAKLLSTLYENQNNYFEALTMYKLYIRMNDSLKNEENNKAIAQQQAKYEYEKQKAIDDAGHEKQIAIEQKAKEKQQILTYATAGGLGLVGIFLIFVFNRLQVTRKQKNIIEEQKQEVEHQKETVEQAHTQLAEKNKEITDSIQYAKRIQSAILPPNKLVKEYLQESFILYKPKDIVAGDFYWMEHKDNKVLFAAADCTGHGVPGAMVSVVCNNGLNRSVREYGLTDPGEILNKTREIVVKEFEKSEEEVKDGMDIALCSIEGNKLQYAGAHNPLWIIRNGELLETKANKQPIGKFDNPEPYTTHTLELEKGDSIYIFSDGYADQFGGEKGKKLKTANFKKLLLSIQNENMQKQKELIDEAFENWKGKLEQLDDVCVIGVRV